MSIRTKSLITALLIGLVATGGLQPTGAVGAELPASESRFDLGDRPHVSGRKALDILGSRLADVAENHGMSKGKLERILRTDHTLKVTGSGDLVYVDKAPQETGQSTITDTMTTPVYSTSQTFALHSRPSAPLKLYLDFTGHTTYGTRWNNTYTGGAAFSSTPYDRDGSPSTFSSLEHAVIQATWLSVREDFAGFNIDVTTQDPGLEGLRRTSSSDAYYGVRVVVSPSASWYPYSAGGVGYLGTFGQIATAGDVPVYVFTNGSNAAKFVSEASSHEAGHALGLSHDGTVAHDGIARSEYYSGHNNWAPIMGSSYNRAVTQWSKGQYAWASNGEDDLAIIAGRVGYAADDYTNSTTSSGTLPAGTARYGVVNWTGDVDLFRFSLTQAARVNIRSWENAGAVDANLNMRMTLRNSALTVLATSSPAGDLRTSMTVTLNPGTYYVQLDGVGEGTAYSNYASLGHYGIVLNWA